MSKPITQQPHPTSRNRAAMRHVVQMSGGVGSWCAGKLAAQSMIEGDELTLLFADTLIEDEDTYRYLNDASANIGGQLATVAEGRDPWQVFFDKRYLGNTRIDPCSDILKRKLLRKWIEDNCDPDNTVIYLGIDWTEAHRFDRSEALWSPWTVKAPMIDAGMTKHDAMEWSEREGLKRQRLYDLGFAHANCGGFCVKGGQAHFENLLRTMPERYAYHEQREQELREFLKKDVAILRDRRGGTTKPWTLRDFRLHLAAQGSFDAFEWGACSCFTPDEVAVTL